MDRALTPEMARTTAGDAYWSHHVAMMYASLGRDEEAMRWIEQAVNVGFINYPMLAEHDPYLMRLRGQPPSVHRWMTWISVKMISLRLELLCRLACPRGEWIY